MKWDVNNVNPMKARPKFATVAEKMQWLEAMIEVCTTYPDQGLQLLGACLIREKDALQKEVENG